MKDVKLTRTFSVSGNSDLDAHTDLVMDALVELEECSDALEDADLSAVIAERTVTIAIVGSGATFDEAVAVADSAIRSAIHAAGGSTPVWEAPVFDPTSSAAELVDA
jgi:hypothetical protein